MNQLGAVEVRFLSYLLSLSLHTIFLAGTPLAFEGSFVKSPPMPQAILLQLVESFSAKLPRSAQEPANAQIVPPSSGSPNSRDETLELPSPQSKWNQQAFNQKQKQIDAKIQRIRSQLKRMKAKWGHTRGKETSGFQVVSMDLKGESWTTYLEGVRQAVLKGWYPRLLESEGNLAESEVRLDFIIDSQGTVERFWVAEWRGSKQFRDLSVEAFQQALPLRPLPPEIVRISRSKKLTISLFFYYQ